MPASPIGRTRRSLHAEYEAIGAELAGLRTVDGAFDLVVIGSVQATWPSTASLGAYAAAGVTWALVVGATTSNRDLDTTER